MRVSRLKQFSRKKAEFVEKVVAKLESASFIRPFDGPWAANVSNKEEIRSMLPLHGIHGLNTVALKRNWLMPDVPTLLFVSAGYAVYSVKV